MSATSSESRPVRVRFAPSPTGFLHIGGVRTALFNWLYARRNRAQGGKFLLRIEDTDTERSEDRFTQDILASMKWLGLDWDEEPIYQSQRLKAHLEAAEELVRKGYAYRCYCSEQDVQAMREKAMAEGRKPMYDRRCRDRRDTPPEGTPFVVRAKVPLEGETEYEDLIYGKICISNAEIDDFVIVRTNGSPIYNLSVVVDDVHSGITHVIRGEDHINNTPKQLHLYRFLDYPQPLFAHLPMILGPDKKKLSKRHGAVSANVYRGEGYLPEALLNFLARLGWSHGDQEVFTPEEIIEFFSFDHVQKSAAVFNAEKLLWVNAEHLKKADPQRLARIIIEDFSHYFAGKAGMTGDANPISIQRVDTTIGHALIRGVLSRAKLVRDIAEQLVPLCTPGAIEVDSSDLKWNKKPDLKAPAQAAIERVRRELSEKIAAAGPKERSGADSIWGSKPSLGDLGWDHEKVDEYLRQTCEQHGLKLGDMMQPMRLVVTGAMASASLMELLAILPWDVVDARLEKVAQL